MTADEHLAVAQRLNRLAEQLLEDGNDVAMAEMFWGTANRITNAIAIQHRLGGGNRLPRIGVVIHHLIARHQAALGLQHGTHAVGTLHGHFYNSHLQPQDIKGHVVDARLFITDLLRIYGSHNDR